VLREVVPVALFAVGLHAGERGGGLGRLEPEGRVAGEPRGGVEVDDQAGFRTDIDSFGAVLSCPSWL
jgi:hypothetical protein